MKTIKHIISFIFVIQSFVLFSQNYSFISSDLHLMTEEEMIQNQIQFSPEIAMYDEEGNTIPISQLNDIMMSGNFVPLVYGNAQHEPKALVFRAATKEEKAQMRKQMAQVDPNAGFTPGEIAQDFITTDLDGEKVSLHELKGKVVVLNFWFIACKPCVEEIPALNKIVSKYKGQNVEFLAITFDDKKQLGSFLKSTQFNYRIVSDLGIVQDYKVSSFPTHMVIDANGEIVFKKIGAYLNELDTKIGQLLKQ